MEFHLRALLPIQAAIGVHEWLQHEKVVLHLQQVNPQQSNLKLLALHHHHVARVRPDVRRLVKSCVV